MQVEFNFVIFLYLGRKDVVKASIGQDLWEQTIAAVFDCHICQIIGTSPSKDETITQVR